MVCRLMTHTKESPGCYNIIVNSLIISCLQTLSRRKEYLFVEDNFINQLFDEYQKSTDCPQPALVIQLFESFVHILYPELSRLKFDTKEQFKHHIQ